MIDSKSDGGGGETPRGRGPWIQSAILAAVCALVIGTYAYEARLGSWLSRALNPAEDYYNLLVQGFRVGQLNVNREVPAEFARLADPYDPAANAAYGLFDLSYYKGKLYLYYGVTPALLLFWPYVALTGQYLSHRQAVTISCSVGFLASVGLLRMLWRQSYSGVSVWVMAAGALALGLAAGIPMLLSWPEVYEVAIGCGYAFAMLALAAIWRAVHGSRKRGRWLVAASVAYGLAVGARPNLLFGGIILLVPVLQAWRERRPVGALWIAGIGPIALIGSALMVYNMRRFGSPIDFGWRYVLGGDPIMTCRPFSARYLWFNFRTSFLAPARWSGRFPFVHEIAIPPLPAGHGRVELPFGVMTNVPLVWLALAVPLAWRGRPDQVGPILRWFSTSVALLFGACALPVCLFFNTCARYEVDFLPALVLLAVVGILGLDRLLAPPSESGQSARPAWRRAMRCGCGVLVAFSVAFNLLASVLVHANEWYATGVRLARAGRGPEAIQAYEEALRLRPDFVDAHNNLGVILQHAGQTRQAIEHWEQALRINPDYPGAHFNLGNTLAGLGRLQEAIGHYEQAVQIKPDLAEAHNNLGGALRELGRPQEAIGQYEQALRVRPDYAEAHYDLGVALVQRGRLPEAIVHWEEALRVKPDFAEAHNNLGLALMGQGRLQEAISHYEEALRISPNDAEADTNLGLALVRQGRLPEAIEHYEQALRIKPDVAEVHFNLGLALEKLGRMQEALQHYEQALRIRPDLVQAQDALERARAAQ
jgi:tetratricopeptide (TPR) repeat protein